jgi:hypothetical protein
MSPRFFNQKIDANEPLKKMPSTAAKAMMRSPKTAVEFHETKGHFLFK